MATIAQDMCYRQSLIKYADRFGVIDYLAIDGPTYFVLGGMGV